MDLIRPVVVHKDGWSFPVYRSIQDVPFGLLPHIAEAMKERSDSLLRQAEAWESMGFYSNANHWRWEARMSYLDAYRMGVELGLSEEDEELEEEINGLVAKREGTTIAR